MRVVSAATLRAAAPCGDGKTGKRVQVKKQEPRGRLLLTGGKSWSADLYACAVPHDSLWYYSGSVGAATASSVCASPFVRSVSYLFPFLPFFSFMNFRLLFSTIQKPLFVQWQRANSTMAYGEKTGTHAHTRTHTSPRRTNNNLLDNHRTNIFFIPKNCSFIFFFLMAKNLLPKPLVDLTGFLH